MFFGMIESLIGDDLPNIKKYDYVQICSERGLKYIYEKNPYIVFQDELGFTHKALRVVFAKSEHCGSIKTVVGSKEDYFICKLKQRHPNVDGKVDFSKFVYSGALKHSTVTCNKHGDYQTKPNWLLSRGAGCMFCGRETIKESLMMSHDDYISKSIEKHGNRYDYSKTKYVSCRKKIDVICREHGIFKVVPYTHLQGVGCQKCGLITGGYSRTDYERVCPEGSFVYLMKMKGDPEDFFKIGISKDPDKRCRDVFNESGYTVKLLHKEFFANAGDAWNTELLLHKEFSNESYLPLNSFSGFTECFIDIQPEEVVKLLNCVC